MDLPPLPSLQPISALSNNINNNNNNNNSLVMSGIPMLQSNGILHTVNTGLSLPPLTQQQQQQQHPTPLQTAMTSSDMATTTLLSGFFNEYSVNGPPCSTNSTLQNSVSSNTIFLNMFIYLYVCISGVLLVLSQSLVFM